MQSRITYNCTVTKLPQAEGNSESFKWLERSYHYIHRQQRETRDEQDKEAAEHRWCYPTHSRYQVVIVTGVFPQDMTIYAKTSGRKHPNGVCFKAAVQTLRPMSPTDVYFKNCHSAVPTKRISRYRSAALSWTPPGKGSSTAVKICWRATLTTSYTLQLTKPPEQTGPAVSSSSPR